jgi:hypothetical protein
MIWPAEAEDTGRNMFMSNVFAKVMSFAAILVSFYSLG